MRVEEFLPSGVIFASEMGRELCWYHQRGAHLKKV